MPQGNGARQQEGKAIMSDSAPDFGHLKIVQFSAENIKRLKAVEITPDGSTVEITGRNAQGKTSILDAIWMAIEWKAASKSNKRPIRDGEDHAMVRVDLGQIIVTRRFAKGDEGKITTSIVVESKSGAPFGRPQEVMDALKGALSFDPGEFSRMGDKDQIETLMGLVTLDFDPVELDAERQRLYDTRHLVGQEVRKLKGAFESLDMPDLDVPTEEVAATALMSEYRAASDLAANNTKIREHFTTCSERVEELKRQLAVAEDNLKTATVVAEGMPEDPDLDEINTRMAAVESTNTAIRAAKTYRDAKADWDAEQVKWDALDDEIAAIDKRKADGLAKAQFPVSGLSFGDGGVTFKGVPFNQASGAEQMKVSMAIAMALNPTLRVIRIKDGSLLDADSMAVVNRLAEQQDFQVWIERVATDTPVGIVIEDGKVA